MERTQREVSYIGIYLMQFYQRFQSTPACFSMVRTMNVNCVSNWFCSARSKIRACDPWSSTFSTRYGLVPMLRERQENTRIDALSSRGVLGVHSGAIR